MGPRGRSELQLEAHVTANDVTSERRDLIAEVAGTVATSPWVVAATIGPERVLKEIPQPVEGHKAYLDPQQIGEGTSGSVGLEQAAILVAKRAIIQETARRS